MLISLNMPQPEHATTKLAKKLISGERVKDGFVNMDLSIKLESLEQRVDAETESILFYRKDFRGVPTKVLNGDGFTVELMSDEG